MAQHEPTVTVVLACRSGIEEARPQLRNLARQTLRDRMEVVLVAARGVIDQAELEAVDSPTVRLLELDRITSRSRAAAEAVLTARTPFVILVENHSFLEPHALETLSRPQDWEDRDAARAPVMRTGNPETLRSLAMFCFVYGHVTLPAPDTPVAELPFHNAMYRREILADLGDDLPSLMENEVRLHSRLIRMGYLLHLVPDVNAWHINEARWRRAVSDPFLLGLRYAQDRRVGWRVGRRALYAAALPAIALLRYRSLLTRGREIVDLQGRVGSAAPLLLLMSTAAAVGESLGYLGLGPTPGAPFWRDFEEHEFHIRGRMADVPVRDPRLSDLLATVPQDLP